MRSTITLSYISETFSHFSGIYLDKIDESIIRILERKAKLSSRALSDMLHLPISTVHRRIQRLELSGTIVGYRALVNYEKTNRPVSALVLINLSEVGDEATHVPKRDVLVHLRKLDIIEEIIEVQAADFDVIIKARFKSLRELSEFVDELRSIQGLEEASSAIITDESVMPPPILS